MQHRRNIQENQQLDKGLGSGSKSAAAPPAEQDDESDPIKIGRRLTQRLGRASVEGKFNKEEVLRVLKQVGSNGVIVPDAASLPR